MKKWLLFSIIIFLISCKEKKDDTFLTADIASSYFSEIEKICDRDSGKLWGENLYGPLMFVDRTSRRIVANQPDSEGLLKSKDGVYTGLFPKEILITHAPSKFGGTLFAVAVLPDAKDDYRIISRAIHGLYHVFQEKRGITATFFNVPKMDEKEARLWIKLEWKALRKAINSEGDERQLAIRDALIFRGSNRELYHKYVSDENRFETYEGLATFTSNVFYTNSEEEYRTRLLENLDFVSSMESYARSYGFIHGALYASLLYKKGFDIRTIDTGEFDLGKAVRELYNIELPPVCRDVGGSLAVNYNIETIIKEEEERDVRIKERIHSQSNIFTEKPVVFLELESPYFDFEQEEIRSLDSLGTLYRKIRVSDNWGNLTVEEGGCLVSNNLKFLRVTAKSFKAEKNHISGDGWHLQLNDDWELIAADQNYFVRKLMP
jgi:hypothetical protein